MNRGDADGNFDRACKVGFPHSLLGEGYIRLAHSVFRQDY